LYPESAIVVSSFIFNSYGYMAENKSQAENASPNRPCIRRFYSRCGLRHGCHEAVIVRTMAVT